MSDRTPTPTSKMGSFLLIMSESSPARLGRPTHIHTRAQMSLNWYNCPSTPQFKDMHTGESASDWARYCKITFLP